MTETHVTETAGTGIPVGITVPVEGKWKVTFTKLNGDERVMNATRDARLIEAELGKKPDAPRREPNPLVTILFDLDKKAFRSCRTSNLVSVVKIEEAKTETKVTEVKTKGRKKRKGKDAD